MNYLWIKVTAQHDPDGAMEKTNLEVKKHFLQVVGLQAHLFNYYGHIFMVIMVHPRLIIEIITIIIVIMVMVRLLVKVKVKVKAMVLIKVNSIISMTSPSQTSLMNVLAKSSLFALSMYTSFSFLKIMIITMSL